jgi:hypothetical protein
MELAPLPQAEQQAGGSSRKFGWNPLTDIAKATTAVGGFIDAHTQIGSFNPGIGAFAASAANMVPGLINTGLQLGKDVVTGQEGDAIHLAGEVGAGMYHGLLDTATDVMTAGGLAPKFYRNTIEDTIGKLPGHYTPKTLQQYATSKGEGLGGALFNDAANVAILADAGAGALGKMDEVGKVATEASRVEEAAKIDAVDQRLSPEKVAEKGAEARTAFLADKATQIAEAGGNPDFHLQQVDARAKALARMDQLRTGAGNIIQPWHALRPFAKAAGELNAPAVPDEAPAVAPESPVPGAKTTSNVSEGLPGASQGKPEMVPIDSLTPGNELRHDITPGSPDEPLVVQQHGDELRVVEGNHRLEAARQNGDTHVPIIREQAPDQMGGLMGMLTARAAGVATKEREAPPVVEEQPLGLDEPKKAALSNWFTTKGQMENVPRAYASYLEQAKPTPEWVKNVVAKMPQPVVTLLQWMDAHHKRLDYQAMTRQQQRALAVRAREIENRPEVQALFKQAEDIVRQQIPDVTPNVASNIVGQIVRAYVTRGSQLVEDLENHRAATEEAMPNVGSLLIDSQLGYSVHIPDELNTPEWRQQMYSLAEPYRQLRKQASEAFYHDEFLGDKGQHDDQVVLTKKELSNLNKAMHKLHKAAQLEADVVPRQLEGLAKDKATSEDAVAAAIGRSQAAMETMVDARTDFDRTRYVPQSLNSPEKLAAVADETANRTVRDNGATYNPTTGTFLTQQDDPGYLVGALPHSIVSVPLDQFMDTNPQTGRMVGAEMIEHFAHGYQEAFAFPNIAIGTWVDDSGNVHIDPTQFLAGESARDRALTLASAREQQSVKELHTGDDIPVQIDSNDGAYFLKNHRSRDSRAIALRQFADKEGIEQDAVDKFISLMDQRAVQLANDHPNLYATPDAVYRGLKLTTLKKALEDGKPPEAEVAGTMIRLTMPSAVNQPHYDLSTGERIEGLEATSELDKTMRQRLSMKTRMEGDETQLQQYRRGVQGQEAIDKWVNAAKQKRLADAASARAQQHVTNLEKMINEREVPINATIDALRARGESKLAKLYDRLEDPALSRVPPRWQPMVVAAKDLAAQIEAHPELEPILGDFPKTFGQAVDYATSTASTPRTCLTSRPQRVRDLIAGTARLGSQGTNDMGKTFTSGARKHATARSSVGAFDNSIEAIVAGLNQVTQEHAPTWSWTGSTESPPETFPSTSRAAAWRPSGLGGVGRDPAQHAGRRHARQRAGCGGRHQDDPSGGGATRSRSTQATRRRTRSTGR